jgi:hypothetical protein
MTENRLVEIKTEARQKAAMHVIQTHESEFNSCYKRYLSILTSKDRNIGNDQERAVTKRVNRSSHS